MKYRHSFTRDLATYFQRQPGVWINAIDLERIGGRQAWRTRVSNCRVKFKMDITNRERKVQRPDGSRFTVSEYRFVPKDVS